MEELDAERMIMQRSPSRSPTPQQVVITKRSYSSPIKYSPTKVESTLSFSPNKHLTPKSPERSPSVTKSPKRSEYSPYAQGYKMRNVPQ